MTDQTERPLADVIEELRGLLSRVRSTDAGLMADAHRACARAELRKKLWDHADTLLSAASPEPVRSPAPAFDPQCRHGCRQAVGLYLLPQGCPCFDDKEQWLCEQHLVKLRNNDYEAIPIFERPLAASAPGGQEGWQPDVEYLAKIFHKAFRSIQDLAPPWNGVGEKHRDAVIAGLQAALAAAPSPVCSEGQAGVPADAGPCEVCGWRHAGVRDERCLRNDGSGECPRMTARPSPDAGVEALCEVCGWQSRGEMIEYLDGQIQELLRENDALRTELDRCREALSEIVDPLTALSKRAEAEGNQLSGMAYTICSDPNYLKSIARAALAHTSQTTEREK